MNNALKIAIPNKGRLSTKIYELLNSAGLSFGTKDERCLKIATRDGKYSLIFVRTQDIPRFLEANVADVGFTGWDVVVESQVELDKVKEFDFGACEMVVAVKDDDPYKKVEDLPDEINIATSFPNIAKKYFEKLGKKAHIIEVSGAVEITPSLGLSDVVIDITSTGSTLKSNRLRIIDKILKSSAVVVARKNLEDDKQKKLNSLMRALNSVIDAQDKKYLMVHVPKNKIDEVKSFMPGLSSPTVTQLWGDNDNVVIHVVVDKDKVYDSIDHLKAIGGKGILILTVDQMVR
ncbi:TPA: ATP phosphoribosyltransferase [Candidatus Galligastranaerophilus intestinavium]|uniref:ATP phosphoribosyltransferase n=1 Tax=Candidatus Galligastranaerophilus intestinavium TaxID=2840836 RepID=A0A9D1FJU0_9BACT|nr:ATP phosphoribosyltransferase [Candidatus Galligastranaerophilus intestinavium]